MAPRAIHVNKKIIIDIKNLFFPICLSVEGIYGAGQELWGAWI